jgi:uncharacterized protein with ATP-grasp and redox domains
MKYELDCIPCFLQQALRTARFCDASPAQEKRCLEATLEVLRQALADQRDLHPPALAGTVYREISRILENPDPFRKMRRETNQAFLDHEEDIYTVLSGRRDPLHDAFRLAAWANTIDYGTIDFGTHADRFLSREAVLDALHHVAFRIDDSGSFLEELATARSLLYIGDNCGEIVLDKLAIRFLRQRFPGLDIAFAVRGRPVINDSVPEDARFCGLDDYATIVATGDGVPGILLETGDEAFLQRYHHSDLVLAKGQGNFESLFGQAARPLYFILKVKCGVVSGKLGTGVGDFVFLRHDSDKPAGTRQVSNS